MDETLSQLADAAASHQWLALGILVVVVVVPIVLKAMGKSFALVDSALAILKSVALSLVQKKKVEEAAKQPGVASVVLVKDVDGKVDIVKELK